MRKCLCFLLHLLSLPYIFSLFSLICKLSFSTQPRSLEFYYLSPNWNRKWQEHVLDFICKYLVTLPKICPWCMTTIYPLYFFSSYSLNVFGTMILKDKSLKNIFKFDTVHFNTTIIIYKYGMMINVIKELKMRYINKK